MAIPKAYQTQVKTDVISGGQNNVTPKMLKVKMRPLINLRKKRKYFWFALVYMIFVCFIKWNSNSRRPQLARKTQAFDNYFSQSILKIV